VDAKRFVAGASHTFTCVSSGVFAKKGGCPTTISYKMTPTLHQSQSWVYPAEVKMHFTSITQETTSLRRVWISVSFSGSVFI